ncbi:MAG: hypothetical protein WBE21_02120 [Candidatus Acidiferrales bacterium]
MRRTLVGLAAVAFLCAAPVFANASGDKDAPKTTKGSESSATAPNKAAAKAQPAKPEDVAPATELQKLQDLIRAQQQELAKQSKALDEQQKEIKALQGRNRDESASPTPVALGTVTNSAGSPVTRVAESSSAGKNVVTALNESSSLAAKTRTTDSPASAAVVSSKATQGDQADQSPLFFKIGGAEFTPLGFLDFTSVYRSTDVGSGIGTSFNSIPFNATSPAGQLSELRFSAQNSRIGLKVDSNPGDFKVRGYLEADFLGNAATNVQVGSHSNTLRMRLYWVDVRRGKWEVLAGQSWSMMTPNRVGISPMPSDIFYSQDMDTNYQLGLIWLRTPGVRLVLHANDNITWGFALEDPEQQTTGLVTFPAGFNNAQVDDNGNGGGSKTPNKAPDVESKLAFDTHPNGGGRNFHVEIAGIYRAFRLNTPGLGNVTKSGGGGSINANLELFKNFHLIANTFWSDGGGRYIFQQGPDFTVNVSAAGNFVPSPLHAGSGIGGFEYTVKKSLLYGYYGGVYFGRNFQQVTAGPPPTFTGYGYPGSGSGQNRTIQEGTIGLNQTLWSDKKYGDLKLLTQISYLSRNPWSTTGTPGNAASAHLGMSFVDLRYDLP